jgi:hypothetical protein
VLRLIRRSIGSRLGRSLLMVASMAVATGMLTLFFAAQRQIQIVASKHPPNLIVIIRKTRSFTVEYKLPLSYVPMLQKFDGVDPAMGVGVLLYEQARTVNGAGSVWVEAQDEAAMLQHEKDGSNHFDPETWARWQSQSNGALFINHDEAAEVGVTDVGQSRVLRTRLGDVPIVGSGFQQSGTGEHGVVLHYKYMDQLLPTQAQGQADMFTVFAAPGVDPSELSKKIDQSTSNSANPTLSLEWNKWFAATMEHEGGVLNYLGFIGATLLFATALSIMTTISAMVREGMVKFAVLRALGFRRARIAMLVISETLLVCAFGGVLGAVIPFIAFYGRSVSMGTFRMAHVPIDARATLTAIAIGVVLALVASLAPAIRAARLLVQDALNAV